MRLNAREAAAKGHSSFFLYCYPSAGICQAASKSGTAGSVCVRTAFRLQTSYLAFRVFTAVLCAAFCRISNKNLLYLFLTGGGNGIL
jgi:hypothetical protein